MSKDILIVGSIYVGDQRWVRVPGYVIIDWAYYEYLLGHKYI